MLSAANVPRVFVCPGEDPGLNGAQRLNTLYEVRVRAEGLFAGANELSDALEA